MERSRSWQQSRGAEPEDRRISKMERIISEDMEYISQRVDHGMIDKSRVLISGATGLIGKYLVRFLAQYCHCLVVAAVRDLDKARGLWEDLGSSVQYIHGDITRLEPASIGVDYVIHGAASTSSRDFSKKPADIIFTAVEGTRRMLEFARKNPVKGFVFLSTMEVYGAPSGENKIDEQCGSNLDTMSARSSYPESKRLCENLCAAYWAQYQVPATVLRLTQTFGPGVSYDDSRVFAEFARCVMEKREIVLHTKGETKRSYLYLADGCTAILTAMTKGLRGQAYNAANETTYCSIKDMAGIAAGLCQDGITVRTEPKEDVQEQFGYGPVLKMNLDTAKLQGLGWKPEICLSEMYGRMIECMEREKEIERGII